jgi:predicted PurR-regulated permease PerM
VRDKILLLFLALFVAVVIDPGVEALERFRVPRAIAVLLHYVVGLMLLVFLFVSFIPIIATQIQQIANFMSTEVNAFLADPQISFPFIGAEMNLRLTRLVESTLQDLAIFQFTDALTRFGQDLGTAAQGSLRFAAQLAGSLLNFIVRLIIVLVIGFFIQLEKERIFRWVRGFFPEKYLRYVDAKSEAIHWKIGQWARGELVLMACIFALTLLALIILRMPYALTLAVLAGFCEFVPAVGPLIAAVPAVLIALSQNGVIWAAVVAGVYYVIQWCENNLLVPLIMKRAVGLSPVAILFAMLIGVSFSETVHPVLGVMLAIPTTTVLALFLQDWRGHTED